MSLVVKLEREAACHGVIKVMKGSTRAPDKNVATLTVQLTRSDGSIIQTTVEVNKMEAETLANALKAGVR